MARQPNFTANLHTDSQVLYNEVIKEVMALAEADSTLDLDTLLQIKEDWIKNVDIINKEDLDELEKQKEEEKIKKSSSDSEEEVENKTKNNMMCLYEKVVKTKNKWKCNFKRGLVYINGKDYPFRTAFGDLEW